MWCKLRLSVYPVLWSLVIDNTDERKGKIAQSCLTLCDLMACNLPRLLFMEFSRQEYWSGLLFPSQGDLPNTSIEPGSPALQADSLPTELLWKPQITLKYPLDQNIQCKVNHFVSMTHPLFTVDSSSSVRYLSMKDKKIRKMLERQNKFSGFM